MNVLSGIHPYGTYSGDIYFKGKKCEFRNIRDSEKGGHSYHTSGVGLKPIYDDSREYFPWK